MILGYASDSSVLPGDTLELHFASSEDATRARVHFYRYGAMEAGGGWTHMGATPECVLVDRHPLGRHDEGWGWPPFAWEVPHEWRSGVYVALALEETIDGARVDPESRRLESVLFVVRASAASAARILYKVPYFTYAAYNGATLGDATLDPTSLYQTGPVTLFRPGIGTDPWDTAFVDLEDITSPRQTFAHWDAKMIAWLERNGYALDYCTDLDVHRGTARLEAYALLLSVGHDEYWSAAMRASVEAFIGEGGNVAFFSANTAWWRTTLDETGSEALLMRHDHWPDDDLETRLTGASYRHGSGRWNGARREPIGFVVQHHDHWVFEDTGLVDGDVLGAEERLVGYECDGTALLPAVPGAPRAPSFVDGTPPGFVVLGVATTPGWDEPSHGNTPTMGLYTRGGMVFTAGTTDWPRVLDAGERSRSETAVVRITKNVLARLGSRRGMS